MARQARKISPTGYYHVMMRGNNRETIFIKEVQKLFLIELLKMLGIEDSIEIVAYCLMDNHIHIVVKGEIEDLSQAIKRINIKYAMNFNKEDKRIGHVFQDRYKSEVVADERYLLQVIRYVHNNPVKAKMVINPGDYKWSSYNEYTSGKFIVINSDQGNFIMMYFSGKSNLFKEFHREGERDEFLDTKEEIEANRNKFVQGIITDYCMAKGIVNIKQILENTACLEELIKILLTESKLSHRKIAGMLDISSNIVHRISKKELNKSL